MYTLPTSTNVPTKVPKSTHCLIPTPHRVSTLTLHTLTRHKLTRHWRTSTATSTTSTESEWWRKGQLNTPPTPSQLHPLTPHQHRHSPPRIIPTLTPSQPTPPHHCHSPQSCTNTTRRRRSTASILAHSTRPPATPPTLPHWILLLQ